MLIVPTALLLLLMLLPVQNTLMLKGNVRPKVGEERELAATKQTQFRLFYTILQLVDIATNKPNAIVKELPLMKQRSSAGSETDVRFRIEAVSGGGIDSSAKMTIGGRGGGRGRRAGLRQELRDGYGSVMRYLSRIRLPEPGGR